MGGALSNAGDRCTAVGPFQLSDTGPEEGRQAWQEQRRGAGGNKGTFGGLAGEQGREPGWRAGGGQDMAFLPLWSSS